jgi:hypothetical protein
LRSSLWIINEHLGRRRSPKNREVTGEASGTSWEGELWPGQIRVPENGTLKTRQAISQHQHVGERTIHRNVKFARAVDTIAG